MSDLLLNFFVWGLVALIVYQSIKSLLSKDITLLWSPITIISLVYIYYCLVPYFSGEEIVYGVNIKSSRIYLHAAAFISYLFILIGFNRKTSYQFTKWNNLLTMDNCRKLGVCMFLIGLACYVPFRGFYLNVFNIAEDQVFNREGFTSYFIDLISLFCGGTCLIIAGKNKRVDVLLILAIWIALVFYIIAGFRFRIVMLLISVLTTYYLFPAPKKLNYPVLAILAIVAYLGFGIMDNARSYGHGLDLETAISFNSNERKGAGENSYVYAMSALAIEHYDNSNTPLIFFEPVVTAICMPIPRTLAPWKPDGEYLRQIQVSVLGTSDYGAAFVFFTEAFMSWWWFGVIIYAYLLGWLCKIFWNNYHKNTEKLGAVVLLGLYNSFCYVLFSRGYMAQALNVFVYFVVMPFWLCQLLRKVKIIN